MVCVASYNDNLTKLARSYYSLAFSWNILFDLMCSFTGFTEQKHPSHLHCIHYNTSRKAWLDRVSAPSALLPQETKQVAVGWRLRGTQGDGLPCTQQCPTVEWVLSGDESSIHWQCDRLHPPKNKIARIRVHTHVSLFVYNMSYPSPISIPCTAYFVRVLV